MSASDELGRLEDRMAGCLYGQALGDAMGAPAYFTIEETRARIGWIDRLLDSGDDHPVHRGFIAGQVTDDTEQAVALARAIVAAGGVELSAVAAALVGWYEAIGGANAPFVGPSSRKAIEALRDGADPSTTGRGGETNGGAMRVAPVGLLHAERPDGVAQSVLTACLPTHGTSSAISAASAVAAAVATGCRPDATLDAVLMAARHGAEQGAELAREQATTVPMASVAARIELAVTLATGPDSIEARLRRIHALIGPGLAATEAVPAAFGMLVLGEGDPLLVAECAANLSGDADTIGAMATAVAGAMTGLARIPEEIRQRIDEVNPALELRLLATGLARLVTELGD